MKQTNMRLLVWMFVVMGLAWSMAGGILAADDFFPCVPEDKLEKEIAPEASLDKLQCLFKKYEGVNTLHVDVTITNKSDKPKRFRVNIFLDNGKAAGGLLPEKVKDGLVEPGKSISYAYPVVGMTEKPTGAVVVKIRTIELE